MSAAETRQELLDHLDKITREAKLDSVDSFTTTRIATDINVSRTLASQYANELVREGLVVKVNSRPVIYLHKASFERLLQTTLDSCEYSSMSALLRDAGVDKAKDFSRAVGNNLSLSPYIEQLKAAVSYPPHGLPVLIAGEVGTGKAFLARLMFEYGKNVGALAPDAKFVRVDCAHYTGSDSSFLCDVFGSASKPGLLAGLNGGIACFENIERLEGVQNDSVLALIDGQSEGEQVVRTVFTTSCPLVDPRVADLARFTPIAIALPPLCERTVEERTALIKHLLRAEGRRVAADVLISRGALRALVEAKFEDNVDGLRASIVSSCSGAYAGADGGVLAVRSYNLPAGVLGMSDAREDDDRLLSCDRSAPDESAQGQKRHLERIVESYRSYLAGNCSFGEFLVASTAAVREYQDHLNFGGCVASPYVLSYERVLNSVFESVSCAHDVDLSRKSSRLLAQCLASQLWGGDSYADWRRDKAEEIANIVALLARHIPATAAVAEQVASAAKSALGLDLDPLSRLVLTLDVNPSVTDKRMRECMGIVCCHGYSTATSIADAANRILRAHVFDAVDMTYDQQVTDVVRPIMRLIDRYPYCKSAVLLVDMGSLTDLVSALRQKTDIDIVTINNASTGLALEVGSALRSGEDVEAGLSQIASLCTPTFSVSRCERVSDAIVFCSESGMDAADMIRRLFAESLPAGAAPELVVVDYYELVANGLAAPALSRVSVRGIVGTMDPGIEGVPFLALESVLYEGPTELLDKVFSRYLDNRGAEAFHANLIKRLTLQNVIASITILNPEKLYAEVSRAVGLLTELTGEPIAPAATLGLYVHLCCLVERLVTKTPVAAHANEKSFSQAHGDFIEAFRSSFADIAAHYRVEVPVTEIAYVFDYISSKSAARGCSQVTEGVESIKDE